MKNFYTNVAVRGDKILFRGIVNGKRVTQKLEGYDPAIYVLSDKGTHKSIYGDQLAELRLGSIKETRNFIKQYEGVDNFPIFGMDKIDVQWISDHYQEDIDYDERYIRIGNLDIEVYSKEGFPNEEKAEHPVTAISLHDSLDDRTYVWAFKEDYTPKRHDVTYIKCRDEVDLLKKFLVHWATNPPDIVTGWNIRFFDIVYIVHRIVRILGEDKIKALSPWGVVNERQVTIQQQTRRTYEFLGITVMDALELYKKYTYTKKEKYSLEFIARIEKLAVQKLKFEGTHAELYENNFEFYIDYNIADVDVVRALLKKNNFIDIVLFQAYEARVNWATAFGPVATWDSMFYNEYRREGLIIPPNASFGKSEQYEGAFVKEPIPGKYLWTCNFDLDSLYPLIMVQWNISPETLLRTDLPMHVANATIDQLIAGEVDLSFLKDLNITMTGNKATFSREKQGILGRMASRIYAKRVAAKKRMIEVKQEIEAKKARGETDLSELEYLASSLHNRQLSTKIFLNSVYGGLGNVSLRYFSVELAEAITITGKLVIQWAELRINKFMNKLLGTTDQNYVIMVDTDSLYVDFEPLVKRMGWTETQKIVESLDQFCATEIKKRLTGYFKELYDYTNAFEPRMNMKREHIAEATVICAKKRYAMSVWNSEGVAFKEPEIKITGIESVRSSTPEFCRDKIKEALKIILTKTEGELQKFILQVEKEFAKLPFDAVSKPTSVSDLGKYYDKSNIYAKGTPGHVKGALLYNHYLKVHGLQNKYPPIRDGDKIRVTYLTKPNIIHDKVISFPEYLPKEFGLDEYVDVPVQFQKTFLAPLEKITGVIGWDIKLKASLESLFD